MKTLLLAALVLASSTPALAQFPFHCRGPFQLAAAPGSVVIHFNAASTGAGNMGENLVSGSCSWQDRALYPSEPARLTISLGEAPAAQGMTFLMGVAQQCAFDSNCRIRFNSVRNGGGSPATLVADPTGGLMKFR